LAAAKVNILNEKVNRLEEEISRLNAKISSSENGDVSVIFESNQNSDERSQDSTIDAK
jgi:hypothetical protein